MLFRGNDVEGIHAGDITLAFRRWKRPTVKAGGTLRIPGGVLAIEAVDVIEPSDVTDRDAHRAGRDSRDSVLAELNRALDDHELIKVKLALTERESRHEAVALLQDMRGVEVVQQVGKTVLLYRANKKPNPKLSNLLR